MATKVLDDAEAGGAGAAVCSEADKLRARGNEHFKAGQNEDAAKCYREALQALKTLPLDGPGGEAQAALTTAQAVRLNLALCLVEIGPQEAIQLCDEALEADPECAKALFRRAAASRSIARSASGDAAAEREALSAARRDLLQAAKLEPGDRQIRTSLEEVSGLLKALGGGGEGLRLGFGSGLYNDRMDSAAASEPPAAVVLCSVCERQGHTQCGREFWYAERAVWLGIPVEEVSRDPSSFEDDGTLREVILAARRQSALVDPGGQRPGLLEYGPDGDLPELSDSEREMLEDCLDSTERPYPQPKRPLPLPQAVRCAEEFWMED
mmetsp:Transcript_55533/g.180143  ORF Transcript_55533/g.180143 Transcript_55533/m.180143 type:complete len:324 (+) Transcript_55533:138-1109(+)